jgi:hypothetical protein
MDVPQTRNELAPTMLAEIVASVSGRLFSQHDRAFHLEGPFRRRSIQHTYPPG